MSMKNGKRSRRKTDDNEINTQDFKAPNPSIKKDVIKPDDKVTDNDTNDMKGLEMETNGSGDSVKTRSRSGSSPDIKKTKSSNNDEQTTTFTEAPIITEAHTTTEEQTITQEPIIVTTEQEAVAEVLPEVAQTEEVIKTVVETEIITTTTTTNGTEKEKNGIVDDTEPESVEIETPVVVVEEEAELELQFDDNSDKDSRKDSPILSRCYTRRSQTRNIPTPKTPKSFLDHNDDKEIEKVIQTEEKHTTNEPEIHKVITQDDEFEFVDLNESRASFESATSTKVNVGNDLTQDIDLTVPSDYVYDDKSNDSSFLAAAKDMTVVETIRKMSSRRTIRPVEDYRKYILRSNAERGEHSFESTQRSSVERLSGVKRKSRCDTPDSMKRLKLEPTTNGFLSLISSPIYKLRSKFSPTSPTEVSASTPKLTGYKQHILENADVSKIDIDDYPTPEKKWCLIM